MRSIHFARDSLKKASLLRPLPPVLRILPVPTGQLGLVELAVLLKASLLELQALLVPFASALFALNQDGHHFIVVRVLVLAAPGRPRRIRRRGRPRRRPLICRLRAALGHMTGGKAAAPLHGQFASDLPDVHQTPTILSSSVTVSCTPDRESSFLSFTSNLRFTSSNRSCNALPLTEKGAFGCPLNMAAASSKILIRLPRGAKWPSTDLTAWTVRTSSAPSQQRRFCLPFVSLATCCSRGPCRRLPPSQHHPPHPARP